MKIAATILIACAITFGTTTAHADPVTPAGWCVFGHVDPNDDNSACRGSDSATWPLSESNPDGTPALSCSRLNDNQHVKTDVGEHGFSYWICMQYKDQWGNVYYEWTEVLGS